jgi:glycerophosphoryl diester phosphodiesterase
MDFVRPSWLVARPIAHRGLHGGGVVENSISAARAAIAGGYAIECDVQLSADGEAMVFHDATLDRLTDAAGDLGAHDSHALSRTRLRASADTIPTLPAFLDAIGRRTPLFCEIKSRFDGDTRLAARVAQCVGAYAGPVALESFDPAVMSWLRDNRARLGMERTPLGMVGQARYDDPADEWAHLPEYEREAMANFLHWPRTRPDFLSWSVRDLPHAIPFLIRAALGAPVTVWTVRTPEQAATARAWANQLVFETLRP